MVVVVADVVLLLLFQNLINRTHCCRDQNIELLTLCTDTHTYTLTPTNTVAATRITLNTAQKNNHQQTNTECTEHTSSLSKGMDLCLLWVAGILLVPVCHFLLSRSSLSPILRRTALDTPLWLSEFCAILDF